MRRNEEAGGVRKKIEDYSFLLSQNIGKGYSSIVYQGRNDATDETVAVKVIDMKMIKGEVHKNLLTSEIEVLKSLTHCDNIIQVYDIFNTKNNTYIITELCDGGDLSKLISSKKCLSQKEAVLYMNQILRGYCDFQNRGIIHRDLKPANIFLKDNTIKIADFGFAMKQADCKRYSSYNVGSPVYMPPEALNQNKYSFKSDIWALGVIYYEMLTGKTPWRAKTQKQLAKQITSIPIKKLLPASISQSSETFLLRCLTCDLNERITPEELQRLTLSCDIVNVSKQLHLSQNSIFNGRNNNIRRADQGFRQTEQRETSLAKNSINTPTNAMTVKRSAFLQSDEGKINNFSLPKTAGSMSTKTEHYLSTTSNQTLNNIEMLTQKQIVGRGQSPLYDKKYLSKQLLSQIHFCRFLYKLIVRINEKLQEQLSNQLETLKSYMTALIFDKLDYVKELKGVQLSYLQDYRSSHDFHKIGQIIEQYQVKYTKDLLTIRPVSKPLSVVKDQLTKDIIAIYEGVEDQEDIKACQEQVIVLDYLVTMRQLIGLLQSNDLEGFHTKSKIETIVEGAPSKCITHEHLNAIRSKLKAIRII